jgi:hypothetical protein
LSQGAGETGESIKIPEAILFKSYLTLQIFSSETPDSLSKFENLKAREIQSKTIEKLKT